MFYVLSDDYLLMVDDVYSLAQFTLIGAQIATVDGVDGIADR
jgi:hypothetical protein